MEHLSPLLCLGTSHDMSRPLSLPSVPLDYHNLQTITTRWRVTAQGGDCVELESVERQINQLKNHDVANPITCRVPQSLPYCCC